MLIVSHLFFVYSITNNLNHSHSHDVFHKIHDRLIFESAMNKTKQIGRLQKAE
jgi:hypothetical protein